MGLYEEDLQGKCGELFFGNPVLFQWMFFQFDESAPKFIQNSGGIFAL